MKIYFYLSRWFTAIFLVVVIFLSDVLCEEPPLQEEKAPDSIDAIIESRDELAYDRAKHSIFPEFYHQVSSKLLEWEQKHGLEITLSYDVLVQGLTSVEEDTGGASGEIALRGRWLMFGEKFNKPAYLSFRLRNRQAYTDIPPSKIGAEAGLLWGTADGFTDAGFQVPDFYVDQEFLHGDLILRYGQFSIDKFVDKHSLRNSKRYFLNQAFAKNPAVNFPSYGAGAVGSLKIGDRWGFVSGISNIQGTDQLKGEIDLSLTSTALFMTLQSSYSFDGFAGKSTQIKAMGWSSDQNREDDVRDGAGVSVTLEHRGLREGENYVFRFASSDGKATGTKNILFLGYGREINDFDHFGIGLAAGQSTASSKWQGVMELYYRWQITKELLITPDFQLITGIGEEENDLGFVLGLRAGVVF
ncbi:MAG: carbohydrate porin [Deltaproteobacteria bacterium]|nr:carbohydrate porin [Deltaproteobacteria bacterium]